MASSAPAKVEITSLAQMASHLGLKQPVYGGPIIGLDPGETTGYCLFDNFCLIEHGQLTTATSIQAWNVIREKFARIYARTWSSKAVDVACEDYRVYSWKA